MVWRALSCQNRASSCVATPASESEGRSGDCTVGRHGWMPLKLVEPKTDSLQSSLALASIRSDFIQAHIEDREDVASSVMLAGAKDDSFAPCGSGQVKIFRVGAHMVLAPCSLRRDPIPSSSANVDCITVCLSISRCQPNFFPLILSAVMVSRVHGPQAISIFPLSSKILSRRTQQHKAAHDPDPVRSNQPNAVSITLYSLRA